MDYETSYAIFMIGAYLVTGGLSILTIIGLLLEALFGEI